MYYDEYVNEMLLDDVAEVSTRNSYNWLRWLLLGFMIFTPAVIVFSVSSGLIVTCLLAYMNCLIIGFGVWWFLRKKTLAAMVPVLFVAYLLLAWPVATIYFAIFHPAQAYYHVISGPVSFFESGIRVQLCVTLFITGYFSVMFYALRNKGFQDEIPLSNPRLFALISFGMALSVIFFNAFSKVAYLGKVLAYFANGLFNYCQGLVFIVGALIKRLPVIFIILGIGALGVSVLFYTIGNARGMAMFPVILLLIGLLFFSGISRKTKVILVICAILFFPTYIVIANTTRVLLRTIGFAEGISYRFQVLKEWRAAKPETSATSFTLGRLFFTGGHSIISRTPSEHPYRLFLPDLFIREIFDDIIKACI
jgi:MFS family permease